MKTFLRKPALAAITALLGFFVTTSQAQQIVPTKVEAEINDIKVEMQKTPEYQAQTSSSKKDGKKREWLEIEVEFETKSNSSIEIVPEVLIKFYIAVKGASGPQILTDQFRLANIVDDEETFSAVYVSPAMLAQISGEIDKFKSSDVVAQGVEILFNGVRVAVDSSSGGPFWEGGQYPLVTGKISPREKTPFGLLWIDRYPQTILN